MSIDLLSNMLSALKNAALVNKQTIEVSHSRECEAVAKLLKKRGMLEDVKVFKPTQRAFKKMTLTLALEDGESVMEDTKRVSKPGRRIYRGFDKLNSVRGGMGILIVSTSRGIMDGKEAKRKKLGGEVICEVY